MPEERELVKQLKVAAKTGKYIVGRREVLSGVKGSRLLVWSASANVPQKILDECKALSVPAIRFNGNPVELGHACGIPFRVSVITLKTAGDADLSAFSNSSDYVSLSQVVMPSTREKEEEAAKELEQSRAEEKTTTKRKSKKKSESTETGVKEAEPKAKKAKKAQRKKKSASEKDKED
jgi:large subunit ribosomal protein L30e